MNKTEAIKLLFTCAEGMDIDPDTISIPVFNNGSYPTRNCLGKILKPKEGEEFFVLAHFGKENGATNCITVSQDGMTTHETHSIGLCPHCDYFDDPPVNGAGNGN